MNTKTPHQIAAEIADIINLTPTFIQKQAKVAYNLVNTSGQQQAILDALPDCGVTAAQALNVYAVMYNALSELGQAGDLAAPDFEIFTPHEDGSVTYTAPEPEPVADDETVAEIDSSL